MRRATITLPDELNDDLERYRSAQVGTPSVTSLVAIALRRFLADPAADRTPSGTSLIERVLINRTSIKAIASRHGAINLRLFGSVARGEADTDSDIDFLTTLEPGRTLFDLAAIRAELENLLDVAVDVIPDTNLEGELRDEILAEALAL